MHSLKHYLLTAYYVPRAAAGTGCAAVSGAPSSGAPAAGGVKELRGRHVKWWSEGGSNPGGEKRLEAGAGMRGQEGGMR